MDIIHEIPLSKAVSEATHHLLDSLSFSDGTGMQVYYKLNHSGIAVEELRKAVKAVVVEWLIKNKIEVINA